MWMEQPRLFSLTEGENQRENRVMNRRAKNPDSVMTVVNVTKEENGTPQELLIFRPEG